MKWLRQRSEEAWHITFRNVKYFCLAYVIGKTRKVCGELVWAMGRSSKAGERSSQGPYSQSLLYHLWNLDFVPQELQEESDKTACVLKESFS